MRLDEIMQPHSDTLASNSTLSLPRLKNIMTNSGLNGEDILYIDDIEILRPNGSVLRVKCAYQQEPDVIGHTNVILSRDQNKNWIAKVDPRNTHQLDRRDVNNVTPAATNNPFTGRFDRRNTADRRSV